MPDLGALWLEGYRRFNNPARVASVFPAIVRRLPHSIATETVVKVRYPDGQGLLRDILQLATERGFTIAELATQPAGSSSDHDGGTAMVNVILHVYGRSPIHELAAAVSEVPEVHCIIAEDVNGTDE